jgi:hypothetical protein
MDKPVTSDLGPAIGEIGHWNEPDGNASRASGPPAWQRRLWRALATAPLVGLTFGALFAGILVALSAFFALKGPTTWTSTTVMVIDDPYDLAAAGDEGQLLKLSELRAKYSGLVSTYSIAQPVANQLHLPVGYVLGSVSTITPLSSLLFEVVATTPTPYPARVLSQAVANEVTSYVQSEEKAFNVPANDRFTITTVDPASAPVSKGPSVARAAAAAGGFAVLGLVVGFCATQLVVNRRLLT